MGSKVELLYFASDLILGLFRFTRMGGAKIKVSLIMNWLILRVQPATWQNNESLSLENMFSISIYVVFHTKYDA